MNQSSKDVCREACPKYAPRDPAQVGCAVRETCDIYLRARVSVLEEKLKRATEDINWMLNNEKLLDPVVFEYLAEED